MAKPNPYRPFTPDPDQMARWPDVSGNTINGLDDPNPRNPSIVYWAPNPDDIPHGEMQRWFYTVDQGDPRFAEARNQRQRMLATPPEPVRPTPIQRSPDDWTFSLQDFVNKGDCEKIGVAKMDPAWVYEGHSVSQPRVIIAGVQHEYSEISKAPASAGGAEVMAQYNRAMAVALKISNWLRGQGWDAKPVTGPMAGDITLIPPALACGFGELGKHGSIIDRDMGASFRLAAILTDAPFTTTPSADHGIDGFCQNCRICEDACPPSALFPEKQTVRGHKKWYVDFDACLPFFNEHQGCAICIAVCPWSRPGLGFNLAQKLKRRADRLGT